MSWRSVPGEKSASLAVVATDLSPTPNQLPLWPDQMSVVRGMRSCRVAMLLIKIKYHGRLASARLADAASTAPVRLTAVCITLGLVEARPAPLHTGRWQQRPEPAGSRIRGQGLAHFEEGIAGCVQHLRESWTVGP